MYGFSKDTVYLFKSRTKERAATTTEFFFFNKDAQLARERKNEREMG
jgi:hypothetical protein